VLRRNSRKYVGIIVGIVIASIFVIAYNLGNILEESEEPEKSDAIVVLMGSMPDRILEAVDLYNKGYSNKIIIVEEYASILLKQKDIKTPVGARINKSIAIEKGVNAEDILILDGSTQSTQDEAVSIRDYLKKNSDIHSIILVTSKYHSFRSKKIFVKALNALETDVKVISIPTQYDKFNTKQWWKNREDIEKVISETFKLLNFYTIDQFKL
jgi:uncharacterized SAM-binding protein YcdF (DUF218 family)